MTPEESKLYRGVYGATMVEALEALTPHYRARKYAESAAREAVSDYRQNRRKKETGE